MNNPQTYAEILSKKFESKKLKTIADYACCAFCTIYKVKPDMTDIQAVEKVADEIGKSLDKECTVTWKTFVESLGKKFLSVKFIDINGIADTNSYDGVCIVRYDYGRNSHWVCVKNGTIVFNPLVHSLCIEKGKATKMRILEFKA